jgi:uncharacterized protein YkwD
MAPIHPRTPLSSTSSAPPNPLERVISKLKASDIRPQPLEEDQLFTLVNQFRASHRLPLLQWDATLQNVARNHARSMVEQRYLSHDTLTRLTFDERFSGPLSDEVKIGESITTAATAEDAVRAFEASPEDRSNLLDPMFHHVGIGIVTAGSLGLMITADFAE